MTERKKKNEPEADDGTTGFNMNTQKLHCLLVLQDSIAEALSVNAGNAFLRGFITEDRATGEVMAKYRFRYKDHDSWFHIRLEPEKQRLPVRERVEYLASGMETVFRMGVEMMAGGEPAPKDIIVCCYPPEPDDAEKTFDWLVAQDLVEVTKIYNERGEEISMSGEAQA
jgi:hypothetical protein